MKFKEVQEGNVTPKGKCTGESKLKVWEGEGGESQCAKPKNLYSCEKPANLGGYFGAKAQPGGSCCGSGRLLAGGVGEGESICGPKREDLDVR
ncbi:MAG: hypothetical protein KDD47_20110 [Acidobacteria bacterium]|nr:hypothetical protein [Acidobacteriota bacterium]